MKKMSAYALTGALALTLAFAAGAVVNPQTADAKVKVKKVTVVAPSGKTAYVAKGKKVKLSSTVKVTPNKKTNKKVTYKSANKKIATVTSKGVVKAKAAGKTKITVVSKKNKKKKATIKVVVKKKAVKKVKLNSGNFVLAAGAKKTLKAKVSPTKNVSKKIAWTSSNKRVATVSSKGVVKGIRDGKAVITAKATDGSGKKAKVTVTVGAGIAGVSVPTEDVVRVVLSGTKALTAKDFAIQTRSGQTSTRYITKPVSSVSTKDQKVYDITLKGYVSERSYLKVTIPALATNKSLEIYIEKIAGYGDATNDRVTYIDSYEKGDSYDGDWGIYNDNVVGAVTYTGVTGLPAGLKAYISESKTSVTVCGKFSNVENGTTATLTGVDEKGTTFTRKYIFYVGDENQLVGGAQPADTKLSYVPDNPKTVKDEETGFDLYNDFYVSDYTYVGGGSGSYSYEVTCNGKSLYDLTHDGDGNRVVVPAGTYNLNITVKDSEKENVSPLSLVVTIILKDGVTVSGTVRDLAGQPAKGVSVAGYTKSDAYGRCQSMYATTEKDGTYSTRVLPGDYYTCCYDGYDITVGNVFSGNTTKNFTLPLYRVNIATNISGVKGYGYPSIHLIDNYGRSYSVSRNNGYYDGDYSMYAYLEPGTYSVNEYYTNTVYAYGKVEPYTYADGITTYDTTDSLGRYKVTGSFSVTGNGTVTVNAEKYTGEDDYE